MIRFFSSAADNDKCSAGDVDDKLTALLLLKEKGWKMWSDVKY